MSTRPDYIDRDILDNLKTYDADIIELGVQSFDPDVLRASNRGHTVEDVYSACRLIKEYGFTLGIQLMIGLPGDSPAKSIASAKETVRLAPQLARLYPTIVLQDTRLLQMYEEGIYQPLTTEEAVSTTKEMYRILSDAGITILRVVREKHRFDYRGRSRLRSYISPCVPTAGRRRTGERIPGKPIASAA